MLLAKSLREISRQLARSQAQSIEPSALPEGTRLALTELLELAERAGQLPICMACQRVLAAQGHDQALAWRELTESLAHWKWKAAWKSNGTA